MEQQVRLYIQAIHQIEDKELIEQGVLSQVEKAEHWYEAKLHVKENITYIQYNDTEQENEEVKTIIKIDGQEITILKYGFVKSKQKFMKGVPYQSIYETPYGTLPLEVDTKDINVQFLSKDDGFIQIDYVLDVAGERLGSRKLDIRVMPDTKRHVAYKH
ncbi:hypothetical protein BHU72_04695 [Desulfuribacillus stibiiarsenatis]|uniref:DUF1934 domain-containing protein n=1 Tax=Desulfuribacillus stibiiarsenatis TaxID=1390249 RepID=A0A1E5L5J5_9FIRM|nr:DUF1934 domain-containing protein [Desulfuribacillus stibiiarsenatis]OEH85391.1 hypothetical protein BHU72_04695 [Desulfuribacillus stibiiarsenatis]